MFVLHGIVVFVCLCVLLRSFYDYQLIITLIPVDLWLLKMFFNVEQTDGFEGVVD